MNLVEGNGYGGLLFNSEGEEENSKFRIKNGNFTNFYQNYIESSTFITSSSNMNIMLEK